MEIVKLLNVVEELPPIVCAADPLKVTVVPLAAVNPPLLLVKLPPAFIFVPAVKVPDERTTLPFTFRVAGAVILPVVSVRLLTTSVARLPPVLRVCPAVSFAVTL